MSENKNGYGKMYYDGATGVTFLSDEQVKSINDAIGLKCPNFDDFCKFLEERKTLDFDNGGAKENER